MRFYAVQRITKHDIGRRLSPSRTTMLLDENTGKWLVYLLLIVISVSMLLGSKNQPFPEISRRFGWVLTTLTALVFIGEQAPRPVSLDVLLMLTLAAGSYGVLAGVHHMVRTRHDVLVAPLAGFLLCTGAGGLMVQTWPSLNTLEQWSGFLMLVLLAGGQTWLVFRGLLIGRLPLSWSQAGMVALERGRLHGTHGAISCFEKGWDADEEHLNPMAYVALQRIHTFLGNQTEATTWLEAFEDAGGEPAVAPEWIAAIDAALNRIERLAVD